MALLGSILGHPRPFPYRLIFTSILASRNYGDSIDHFTTDLLRKTEQKWKNAESTNNNLFGYSKTTPMNDLTLARKTTKQLLKEINSIYDSVLCVDIRKLTPFQLDDLMRNACAEENKSDLVYLTNECIRWEKLPSEKTLVLALEFFRIKNQISLVEKLSEFCQARGEHPGIRLFNIKQIWIEGNVDKALLKLETLYSTYKQNTEAKETFSEVRESFNSLIDDTLVSKSEAVLIKLVQLVEKLQDYSILEQIWNRLFASEWFSDQQISVQLFSKHLPLRRLIIAHLNYFTFLLLRDHKVETVYRLIELLLEHRLIDDECKRTLALLFDYQFWKKDLRACSEILQTCIQLGIPLAQEFDRKLLLLVLAPKQNQFSKDERLTVPPVLKYKF